MTRVLHLLDHDADFQTRAGAAQLQNASSRALTLGAGGDLATRLVALLRLHHHTPDCDLIHAWGANALTVAAVASRKPIVYSPTIFPNRDHVRWLRAVMAAREVNVVCSTEILRRRMVERGVPIDRCHRIRPGVDFANISRRKNDILRATLGFSPDDYVLLACGESLRGANHHMSLLTTAILNVYDPHFKILLWGRGPLMEFERTHASQMLPRDFFTIATDKLGKDVAFEQLFSATNAVLITPDAPIPTLPIAVCMAAALPIIACATPTVSELLEDRHTALMVGKNNSRVIGQRVIDLRSDSRLEWSLCDTARTEAYEFFSKTRFIAQYNEVYDQVRTGKQVSVTQSAPGAGMRFIGRA